MKTATNVEFFFYILSENLTQLERVFVRMREREQKEAMFA